MALVGRAAILTTCGCAKDACRCGRETVREGRETVRDERETVREGRETVREELWRESREANFRATVGYRIAWRVRRNRAKKLS